MKKQLLALSGAVLLVAGAWRVAEADKALARVEQVQGLYVFTDSRPVAEYDYLGTVNAPGVVMSSSQMQYPPVRDALIKRGRQKYPEANGIILHFVSGSSDKADLIRFKQ